MEPPAPALSLSTSAATTTTTVPPHLAYPDSLDSSPRSRNTDSWDDTLPTNNAPTSAKLRLMCSYGGHIVPRPHDKSLCYVGGDTRIVVVDRHTSLSDLSSRLSKTLLNNRPFTLKYQLPNEDLDSLISVTTDEDLDNMIDEYDRISSNSIKPSRVRLFLFPLKPDSSQSIGPILENSAKSEDWFLNALNAAGLLNRGFSDPASVNCLLGLEDDSVGGNNLDSGGARDLEAAQPGSFGNGKSAKQGQDVHSVPDSPMLETTSSFGSTSSSPSLANLPPIRVHVEDGGGSVGGGKVLDQKVGIEEQFAQISVSSGPKQDEGFSVISSPPLMPVNIAVAPAMSVSSAMVVGEYPNRVISDDERSDHGVPVGYRRVPAAHPQSQPQTLPPQSQPKSSVGLDLPSPDSVSSDSSMTNPLSRQKPVYQDPVVQIPSGTLRIPANPVDPKFNISEPNSRVQMQQQVPDSAYVLQSQFDQQQQLLLQQTQHQHQQQQFMQGAHYVHHTPTGVVPISAYYPVYPSQQQHHHHQHNPLDQQYSAVYYVPSRQTQAYNLSVQQSNISEAAAGVPSSRPQTPPTAAMVPPSAVYNPTRNATMTKPEMAAGAYRTATTGAPQLVQVPSSQHQQQYLGYSQIHHPSQSMAPTSAAANYAYEYAADPAHGQIYYTQPLAPTMHSQYQTMTPATAVVLPETSGQLPTDNSKQQIRTSQPL